MKSIILIIEMIANMFFSSGEKMNNYHNWEVTPVEINSRTAISPKYDGTYQLYRERGRNSTVGDSGKPNSDRRSRRNSR